MPYRLITRFQLAVFAAQRNLWVSRSLLTEATTTLNMAELTMQQARLHVEQARRHLAEDPIPDDNDESAARDGSP